MRTATSDIQQCSTALADLRVRVIRRAASRCHSLSTARITAVSEVERKENAMPCNEEARPGHIGARARSQDQ